MTLSAAMITRYTTEVDIDWCTAIVLQHPAAGIRCLVDHHEDIEGDFHGVLRTFEPVPFSLLEPASDDSGRQEVGLTICGINGEARAFLDAAIADPRNQIRLYRNIFILGDTTPQRGPWLELALSNVTETDDSVTGVATRADVLNRAFPSERYGVDQFPGLRRR